MDSDRFVLTEDDAAFLRTLRQRFALTSAWPCIANRPPYQSRPIEARDLSPQRERSFRAGSSLRLASGQVHHLTATDGIIAGLFAAYTAYRLWSGWGDGVIYGDGDDDVRADEQSTACRGDGPQHHFHRHHFGLFRVPTWRAEASPFPAVRVADDLGFPLFKLVIQPVRIC